MEEENIVDELNEFADSELSKAIKIYETEMFVEGYSIFKELHEIMEDREDDHNCIGCNLDEYTSLNYSTLLLLDGYTSFEQKINMLIISIYLLVERIDTILGIISLNEQYRKDTFKTLTKIRKWANFIKHPKAFILAHHPVYTIDEFKHNPDLRKGSNEVINTSFLFKYYSNDDKNKELFKRLENREGLLVVFPNPATLINEFCNELKIFNRLLKNNEIYRDILKKRSTFLGFWVDEEE